MDSDLQSGESAFRELLQRAQAGEQDAVFELVRRYETTIRVAVRIRLSDPALRRQLDSMDVCQSVFASFFLGTATRQYDMSSPKQLVALLTKMVKRKVAMRARGHFRQRRDARRTLSLSDVSQIEIASMLDPAKSVADQDLLLQAYDLMSPSVRRIAKMRIAGQQWSEIAAQLGGTAESRRKEYRRAIDSIALQLGIE